MHSQMFSKIQSLFTCGEHNKDDEELWDVNNQPSGAPILKTAVDPSDYAFKYGDSKRPFEEDHLAFDLMTSRGPNTLKRHSIMFPNSTTVLMPLPDLTSAMLDSIPSPNNDEDRLNAWRKLYFETIDELVEGCKLTQLGKDDNYYVSSYITLSPDGKTLSTTDGGFSIIEFPVTSVKRVYSVRRQANLSGIYGDEPSRPTSPGGQRSTDYIVAIEFTTKKVTVAFVFRDEAVGRVFEGSLKLLVEFICRPNPNIPLVGPPGWETQQRAHDQRGSQGNHAATSRRPGSSRGVFDICCAQEPTSAPTSIVIEINDPSERRRANQGLRTTSIHGDGNPIRDGVPVGVSHAAGPVSSRPQSTQKAGTIINIGGVRYPSVPLTSRAANEPVNQYANAPIGVANGLANSGGSQFAAGSVSGHILQYPQQLANNQSGTLFGSQASHLVANKDGPMRTSMGPRVSGANSNASNSSHTSGRQVGPMSALHPPGQNAPLSSVSSYYTAQSNALQPGAVSNTANQTRSQVDSQAYRYPSNVSTSAVVNAQTTPVATVAGSGNPLLPLYRPLTPQTAHLGPLAGRTTSATNSIGMSSSANNTTAANPPKFAAAGPAYPQAVSQQHAMRNGGGYSMKGY